MKKIIRITTVPISLDVFCRGMLRELSAEYEIIALSSPGKELDDIAKRERVRTIAVPMERQISIRKDLLSLYKLIQVFRKEKPEMVHSMTPKAGLLSMTAARIAKVPVRVHTFTGLLFPTAKGWRQKLLMLTDRITCACSTQVIAEGKGVKNDLKNYGITHKVINVLGNGSVRGIDLQYYARIPEVTAQATVIRKKLNIHEGEFTFIFVGRLVGDKGINELVEAFCELQMGYPQIHLILVGGEEKEDSLKDATKHKIATTENIHSVGWQTDVRPWYAASDALAFPSYREGFPNVVIEAGAMGLPAIVTDINGAREIIINEENGIIIPPLNENALYTAMKRWVENPAEVQSYANAARKLIASRYEQRYVWQCLKDFYRQIMA